MDNPSEFHDPFNGDTTLAFDEADAVSSFWDELDAGGQTQPCPQSTDPPTKSIRLSNKKAKKMRFRMGRSKLIRKAKLFLQEWDGTAEALADTLRYTVE